MNKYPIFLIGVIIATAIVTFATDATLGLIMGALLILNIIAEDIFPPKNKMNTKKATKAISRIWKWIKELPYSRCPKCGNKSVYFSHEEHFVEGSPSVYYCKSCKEYFN